MSTCSYLSYPVPLCFFSTIAYRTFKQLMILTQNVRRPYSNLISFFNLEERHDSSIPLELHQIAPRLLQPTAWSTHFRHKVLAIISYYFLTAATELYNCFDAYNFIVGHSPREGGNPASRLCPGGT